MTALIVGLVCAMAGFALGFIACVVIAAGATADVLRR